MLGSGAGLDAGEGAAFVGVGEGDAEAVARDLARSASLESLGAGAALSDVRPTTGVNDPEPGKGEVAAGAATFFWRESESF